MIKCFFTLPIILIFFFETPAFAQKQNINLSSENGQVTALITSVEILGKKNIIKTDNVQMLTGKAAIAAARKYKEAEYEINKKKDTVWYVPDDYYVVNENNKIRTLLLAENAQIYLVKEGASSLIKSDMAKLKKSFKGKLFSLNIADNKVIKISEIYTP